MYWYCRFKNFKQFVCVTFFLWLSSSVNSFSSVFRSFPLDFFSFRISSDTEKKSDDILKEKKSSGNGLKTEEKELTEDDNHKKKVTQKTLVKKKIKNHKKRKLEEKKKTRQKDLYCGSYSHHRGRRCTGIADSKILNNLYVITFEERIIR